MKIPFTSFHIILDGSSDYHFESASAIHIHFFLFKIIDTYAIEELLGGKV
jgi:hypothetical protein